MRKFAFSNSKGSIFLTTMICTLLMTMVGGYTYQMTTSGSHFANQLRRSTQAQQLAEAGLAEALSQISDNWSAISGGFPSTALGEGTYQASVVTAGGRYLVESVGTVQGAERTASAEVTAPVGSALDYVFAGGSTGAHVIDSGTGQSAGSITGDIYMAGPLTIDGPPSGGTLEINGDVYSQSTITEGSNLNVSGSSNADWSTSVPFPTVDFSYYQTIATNNGQYFAANKIYTTGTLPVAPAGGVIFVNGNITIQGTQTTTACIIATGNISIVKSGSVYPRLTVNQFDNYPAVMTQNGNISFVSVGNGGAFFNATGLVYSGNNFTLSSGNHDTFSFTGCVLARGSFSTSGLTAWNNITATYVPQAPPGVESGSADTEIRSYNQ